MKQTTIIIILALAVCQLSAKTYFVKQNSQGNGTSWASAFGCLHEALRLAQSGDEIWVAKGEYFTTSGTDRSLYFNIQSGVKLYGGFAGHEQSVSARSVEMNRTVLSGEIGTASADDNAYTVIFTKNVSSSTLVDGFVITGGSANKDISGVYRELDACGAGWYNMAKNGTSSPTIKNCKFVDNNAREGAALFNFAFNGEASPIIESCLFSNNTAKLDGGAIYNGTTGNNSKAAPKIKHVNFEYNIATYGGGIINKAFGGKVTPMIQNCHFASNQAYFRGAGVYNDFEGEGTSKAVMVSCVLDNNISSVGEAISSRAGSFGQDNGSAYSNTGL